MPIDYSKWDKIELSDDSDIEVHPNVDKQSFIRWKQRDIHEKRHERDIQIKTILVQLTMYAKLNARVDFLLKTLSPAELLDASKVSSVLNAEFDPKEKFDYEKLKEEKGSDLRKGLRDLSFDKEELANTPTYNEMMDDLFVQIKEDHPEVAKDGPELVEHLKEHRKKIDDVLLKQTIALDKVLYEKSMLISSDDYHTGFDRSFLNKDKEEEEKPPAKETKKETVTTVETLNTPKAPAQEKTEQEMFDELDVLPATAEYAKIPHTQLHQSAEYLIKHPSICTENQKDSLIMTAFDRQLEGDSQGTKQIVYQSLLLQYISQLAGPLASKDLTIRAIKLFFSRLEDQNAPASRAFLADVENTVNHIKNRCEILKQEHNAGEDDDQEQLIQLKSLDDSTELFVNTPQEGTDEYNIFLTKLSPDMQTAIKTGSLDEVNKVFAKMKIEDAERTLEVFNECNVIGISGVLENEQEFEKLKDEYEESSHLQQESEQGLDTVDIVD